MFERYTEKARRVIFFARYEASQYGSSAIETHHMLLGLAREDPALLRRLLGQPGVADRFRSEIERQITRGQRVSTSVEMPLSAESQKALKLAAEEADRLHDRHIGTEHLLVGMLRLEGSLAGRLLRERGLKPETIREQLAKASISHSPTEPAETSKGAITMLDRFLGGLQAHNWEDLAPFFAKNTHFVDSAGERYIGRDEIEKQFEVLFAPYAKKNVTFVLEGAYPGPAESVMASILWENVTFGSQTTKSKHRMTVILTRENEDWAIFLLQITPIVAG
jgi:ATP-dependent Clp protease ATP-binding subunit ClpA